MYNRRAYDSHRSRTPLQRGQPRRNQSPTPPPPPPPPLVRPHSRHNINQYGYGTDLPLRGQPNYDPRSGIPGNDRDSASPPGSHQIYGHHDFYRYVPNPFARADPYNRPRHVTPGDEHRRAPPDSLPATFVGTTVPSVVDQILLHHPTLLGIPHMRRLSRGPGERSPSITPDVRNSRNAPKAESSDSGTDSDYSRLQRTAAHRVRAWPADQARRVHNSGGRM
ncbi:hypothetical protein RUND412_002493 [Rhizina undulata]